MNYNFENSLTARDCKRHIPHTFVLPAACGQMDIDFRFAPQRVHGVDNLLTLAVFDPRRGSSPHGFRGAGHRGGGAHHVHISATEATPGYLPGLLPAGEWTVEIDTHMIMPGEAVHYELDITIAENANTTALAAVEFTAGPSLPPPVRPGAVRGAGWYRGDLHTHTHHSDAAGLTVASLLQVARAYELDFVFLTDHNTISGLAEMDALSAPDLLAAGGIELTTFWGHALCLGTRDWVDWRVRPDDDAMARIAAAAYANGQVFVIAHPQSEGDPGCTGCAWRYGRMMPGNAQLVEIWNGPWRGGSNEAALALWYDWLNQGLRLVATAGTDVHGSEHVGKVKPGFNVVYAEALTEAALLKALCAGRLYLSAGPQLVFQAQDAAPDAAQGAGGKTWISGDTVAHLAGPRPISLAVAWDDCPADAQMRVMANGRLMNQQPAGVRGQYAWDMRPEQADWVTVEIRGGNGDMLAVSNPIFLH